MIERSGTVRLASMFDELTITDRVDDLDREVNRIAAFAGHDPELNALHDQHFDLMHARTGVPPADFTIDVVADTWWKREMPDFVEMTGMTPATWLYRNQLIDATPEGHALRQRLQQRLRELDPEGA